MTLTVQPHRESIGLKAGQLYLDGQWGPGGDGATWTQRR
jgi:aldehyde dehydrogenase (NAD+)